MAGASKTNVAARAGVKGEKKLCKLCGNPVEPVLVYSSTGKKKMTRLCCEAGKKA